MDTSRYIANIVDYKTGRPKDDDTQLAINAGLIFASYPQVVGVNTIFVWTEYDDTMHSYYTHNSIKQVWDNIRPRVEKLKAATLAQQFPPIKGKLCRQWCPVTTCEFNGK